MRLEHLKRLLDQVAENQALALRVLDLVAQVSVALLEQVHHGQDLSVVGHEGLADGVGASHEALQNLQGDRDDLVVTGVQSRYSKFVTENLNLLTLDGDDQLGNHRQHLCAALFKHVKDTLHGQEAVGVLLLADALKEDGQVVVVVKLHNVDLPEDLVGGAVLNSNGQVTAVVEASEFRGRNGTGHNSAGLGSLDDGLGLGLVQ